MSDANLENLPSAYDPTEAENKWYPIWEEAGYFSPEMNPDGEPYTIVIPPPNVTGSLHMGHALTVTIQDMLIRWRRMQGRKTLWLPGTDHAGIATQMVVERELKASEDKTRHDLGREAFLERVWEWKEQYGNRISKQLRVLGCSLDWSRERFTMDEQLSVAVREVFVQLYEEGLIYRAERLVNWCPQSHTALSDLEVERIENYKGELYEFAYPLSDGSGELVVATTRPETMLGDSGIAVHPEDERYQHLIGKTVKHPILGYEIPIVGDAILVDPEFGTGAVKVTPAHDFNDFETGKRHKLQLFNIFDINAHVVDAPDVKDPIKSQIDMEAWAEYAGLERYEARKKVKAALKELGLEKGEKEHEMALGISQRSGAVVEPMLSIQWFVDTKPLAEPALAAVKTGETKIIPETWTKTYYHWMENIQDWCISRQLWWGHRIPAWYCLDCNATKSSDGEIRFDALAKPIVARETPTACPECNGTNLTQEVDVLDTWFSSGLWPFSTLGWPDNKEDVEQFYPNTVMETGFDILFFWVARMMMMGCKFMGKPPFPTIYLHAMVRDKNGDKMSKTKGNVIDPLHLINGCDGDVVSSQFKSDHPDGLPAFGADALRFTLASMSASGRDIKLSVDRIAGYRAFANKIWNASRFALMRLEGTTPKPLSEVEDILEPADRYILSRLARAATATNTALEEFKFADAASAVYSFFWHEFCDWYIELAKKRLMGDDEQAKAAAQSTLVGVLDEALRMLHPMMPFITEELWQKLPIARTSKTIMLASYPETIARYANDEIEAEYVLVKDAITAIRTVRAESGVAPSKRVEATLICLKPETQETLAGHEAEIVSLARLSTLTLQDTDAARPEQAGVKIMEHFEAAVPLKGLVDFGEEASRLEKSIEKHTKEHDKIAKKLANENFVARAPEHVVAKDRARVAELQTMLAKMNESLERVREMADG
ncbi:MAG: valine--tRNA ligase [Deltaproteobacteria bacterium]|jgi:valyl-tRNA synthetase|nr:valine--tRNA ligase [Deltaproteobacteria bacterium]